MTASAKPGFAPTKETHITGFTLVAIILHVVLKYALHFPFLICDLPLFAALYLLPMWGAIGQEIIDLLAVLNAVRVALPTEELQDY